MFKYFKPYLFRGFLASLFKMGESFADLSLPYFMALIIDNGVGNHNINYIIKIATLMVIISLLGYSSSILSNYLSCKTSQEFGSNLRKVMFSKIQFFSFEKTNKYSQSSLITRITKDVNQITQMFLMCIRMVFIFKFVKMVLHMDWFVYIEDSLHPWVKYHLIIVDDPFNVLLDSVC